LRIEASFENAISSAFYDKEITLYNYTVVTDSRGWSRKELTTSGDTVSCNVSFEDLALVQENYGLAEKIDIIVRCSEELEVGDLFDYEGKKYSVMISNKRDSHNYIIARKWLSKSTELISS